MAPRKRHITAPTNPITSYFTRLPPSTTHDNPLDTRRAIAAGYAPATLAPALPNEVQSSLLNVGMRIRKAVPEGYKHLLAKQEKLVGAQKVEMRSTAHAQVQGLQPFCGMHKIGGYAVQETASSLRAEPVEPFPAAAFGGGMLGDCDSGDDGCGFPLSSQESTMTSASTDSMPAVAAQNKRRFSDEEEDEADGAGLEETATLPFPGGMNIGMDAGVGAGNGRRMMARMKGHGRGIRRAPGLVRTVTGDAEMDFDEAEFLRPRSQEGDDIMDVL